MEKKYVYSNIMKLFPILKTLILMTLCVRWNIPDGISQTLDSFILNISNEHTMIKLDIDDYIVHLIPHSTCIKIFDDNYTLIEETLYTVNTNNITYHTPLQSIDQSDLTIDKLTVYMTISEFKI